MSSFGGMYMRTRLTLQQNKELEATEERKRKAKQLEMQRKESARARTGAPRTPQYPTYTPPARPAVAETYDTYEAEKNKAKWVYSPRTLLWRLMCFQVQCAKRQRNAAGQEVQDNRYV